MKKIWPLFYILTVAFLALAGCKKEEQTMGPPQEYYGVKLNWSQLNTAFTNASPEVQNDAYLAVRAFRYSQFPKAMFQLEKLAEAPGLTDAQKIVVAKLIEQTKQVIAKAPPASGAE
jgi:hypothetical protein